MHKIVEVSNNQVTYDNGMVALISKVGILSVEFNTKLTDYNKCLESGWIEGKEFFGFSFSNDVAEEEVFLEWPSNIGESKDYIEMYQSFGDTVSLLLIPSNLLTME